MTTLALIRDGTIVGPNGTEIDLRTPDYSVWLTVKAEKDADAEAVAAALGTAFPPAGPDATEGGGRGDEATTWATVYQDGGAIAVRVAKPGAASPGDES